MKNFKTTKKALLASVLSLIVCCTMLVGTTFAWFTDVAESKNNVIQTGNLDIEMYWAEGTEEPQTTQNWNKASEKELFSADSRWEPGYSEAKHVKIANDGSLAFKYQMRILATGIVSELAEVIDVYYFENAVQLDRPTLATVTKLGTLKDVLNPAGTTSISTITGALEADAEKIFTIAFKMQESAGNEYQGMAIGSGFTIQVLATQLASESDSFGADYDANANLPVQETPQAMVSKIADKTAETIQIVDTSKNPIGTGLDTAYQFQPTETFADIEGTAKEYWHADFVVKADRDVPGDSMMLAGYYQLFSDVLGLNGSWIGLSTSDDIPANQEIRLLMDGMSGITINYSEICDYGNDGIGFLCGAADLTGENAGTTLTVELRLFETEEPSEANGNSKNIETGNSIVIGTFSFTFPNN